MVSVYEMVDNLKSFANEDTDNFLDNETIVRFLNKGLSDVLSIVGRSSEWLLNKNKTIDVDASEQEYNFPVDVLGNRIRYIKYKDQDEWITLKEKHLKNETTLSNLSSGHPRYFIRFGTKFRVYPTPSAGLTNGFDILYTEKVYKMEYPIGSVSNIINGERIYLNNYDNEDKGDNDILSMNDYISVTDSNTGKIVASYRIKNINDVDGYVDIYTGETGLTITSVDQTNRSITFSGSPDLSNVISGDLLTISGSTGNDDEYTIIGVNDSSDIIYISEALPNSTGDGTVDINMPTTKKELPISTTARSISSGDYLTSFGKAGATCLDEVHDDYIEQFALYKVLKKAKEPTEDELMELKRKAEAVQDYSSDRKTPYTIKIRNSWD